MSYTADGPNIGESADDWVRALRRLGVTDIVVDKVEVDNQMKQSTLAKAVWTEGPVTIYEVLDDSGGRPPILLDPVGAHPTSVRFSERGPERLTWDVDTTQPFAATLAVAWSPKWHAQVDGRPAHITQTPDGIMEVAVPRGRHSVTISYRPDLADRVGALLTLATLGWLVAFARSRSRRARSGTAARDDSPVAS